MESNMSNRNTVEKIISDTPEELVNPKDCPDNVILNGFEKAEGKMM